MGVLGEPWNEFDTIVSELGWGENIIVAPVLEASLELRLDPTIIPSSGGSSPLPGLSNFEDFETGFTTWTNTVGDDNDCWRHRNSPTPSSNTGPSTGADGTTWFVFYEASNGCSPGAQQAFLLGPTINFDAFNSVEVTFWRHMWDGIGGDQMGRLALELEDDQNPGTFTEVWFQQGNQGNQWDQITVDLSSEDNTGQRQIRFVATEVVAGIQSDMAVDEITIQGNTGTGGTINLITACIFTSPENIPAGTGLSQGRAICKLLDAPADQGGVAIAEGRVDFNSYTANDELVVFITNMAFPFSNSNELIFDTEFIIEAPI